MHVLFGESSRRNDFGEADSARPNNLDSLRIWNIKLLQIFGLKMNILKCHLEKIFCSILYHNGLEQKGIDVRI